MTISRCIFPKEGVDPTNTAYAFCRQNMGKTSFIGLHFNQDLYQKYPQTQENLF